MEGQVSMGFGDGRKMALAPSFTKMPESEVRGNGQHDLPAERLWMSILIETIFSLKLILFLAILAAVGSPSLYYGMLFSGLSDPNGAFLQLKIYRSPCRLGPFPGLPWLGKGFRNSIFE